MRKVRLLIAALASLVLVSCGGKSSSPTTPTPPTGQNATLAVSVMAEGTPAAGAVASLSNVGSQSVMVSQTTDGQGKAQFSGLNQPAYTLKIQTSFGFGVLTQNVSLPNDENLSLNLKSVDDIIVDAICVDGDCSIQPGATIAWPVADFQVKGRWKGVTYPWPNAPSIGINVAYQGSRTMVSVASDVPSPFTANLQADPSSTTGNGWVAKMKNFVPCDCGGATVAVCQAQVACYSQATTINLILGSPAGPGGSFTRMSERIQPWTLNFQRK